VRGRLLPGALLAAGLAVLLVRVVPDVRGAPLFEDEAVSGLVAARPVREILGTVLWDRGGAPLHFLLAHLVFVADASATSLRVMSVVAAVGAVVATFDLARRLAGPFAGGVAALLCGGSSLLAVYGSFGRMYALFALAGALAGDALVRALQERTRGSVWLAVAAGWLLPAVHPYGGIVLAVEVVVLLVVLRRRALWPVVTVAIAAAPFLVADLRLARRFRVGDAKHAVATPGQAWDQLQTAVQGFAGGRGAALVVALALAALGGWVLWRRRERAFVVFALVSLVAPPLLAVVSPRGGEAPDLSPRHLAYALPLWSALAGAAAGRLARGGVWRQGAVAAGALALVLLAPRTTPDPRTLTFAAPLGSRADTAAPAAWLRARVGTGDVLFPYSAVFLAALPQSGHAVSLPRAQAQALADTLRRAPAHVRQLVVAVPLGPARLDSAALARELGPRFAVRPFPAWLLVAARGPLTREQTRTAALRIVRATRAALRGDPPEKVVGWLGLATRVLRDA
jgi:mannosyltransferase